MANRIGSFFAAYPDRAEAQREIANHLQRFWEPRMRRALFDHLDRADGLGLDVIVLEAVRAYRTELAPRS